MLSRAHKHDDDTLRRARSSRVTAPINHLEPLSSLLEQIALTTFKRFIDISNRYGQAFPCAYDPPSRRALESASSWLFSTTTLRSTSSTATIRLFTSYVSFQNAIESTAKRALFLDKDPVRSAYSFIIDWQFAMRFLVFL